MPIADKVNTERQLQAYQLIAELLHERQETWSLYCHVTELMSSSVNRADRPISQKHSYLKNLSYGLICRYPSKLTQE